MGKWANVGDVVSPRLNTMLMVCVAERRCAVPVTSLCSTCDSDMRTRWHRRRQATGCNAVEADV